MGLCWCERKARVSEGGRDLREISQFVKNVPLGFTGGNMKKETLEVLLEDISSKFDLVLEGHAALDKKIDLRFDELNEKTENNSFKIDALNKKIDAVDEKLSQKIDAVAADLKAHRSDTEAHHGVYRVKES